MKTPPSTRRQMFRASLCLLLFTPLGTAHGGHDLLHVGSLYGEPTSFTNQLAVGVSFEDDCPIDQSLVTQLEKSAIDDSLILPTTPEDRLPRPWLLVVKLGCLAHSDDTVWSYRMSSHFWCTFWPSGLNVLTQQSVGYAGRNVVATALEEAVSSELRRRINHFTKANMHHAPMDTPTCIGPLAEPIGEAIKEIEPLNPPPE